MGSSPHHTPVFTHVLIILGCRSLVCMFGVRHSLLHFRTTQSDAAQPHLPANDLQPLLISTCMCVWILCVCAKSAAITHKAPQVEVPVCPLVCAKCVGVFSSTFLMHARFESPQYMCVHTHAASIGKKMLLPKNQPAEALRLPVCHWVCILGGGLPVVGASVWVSLLYSSIAGQPEVLYAWLGGREGGRTSPWACLPAIPVVAATHTTCRHVFIQYCVCDTNCTLLRPSRSRSTPRWWRCHTHATAASWSAVFPL